ncbi:MAG: hypothetical protein AAGL24_18765 [Pseudomonadota bacterium]
MLNNRENSEKTSTGLLVEIVRVSPQYFWAIILGFLLYILHDPIFNLLNQGKIQEITAFSFTVKLAGVSEKGNGENIKAEDLGILDRRGARIAQISQGKRILWVDNKHPVQNLSERKALEEFGIIVDLANKTSEALKFLEIYDYTVVITDLNREDSGSGNDTDPPGDCDSKKKDRNGYEFKNAGCALLNAMGEKYGNKTPRTIVYSASSDIAIGMPPFARGMTNRADELFHLIFDAIERQSTN